MLWLMRFSIFSIKQLFRTADLMYSMPVHRATIYIFGIFTGYAMRMYKHVRLSKVSKNGVCHLNYFSLLIFFKYLNVNTKRRNWFTLSILEPIVLWMVNKYPHAVDCIDRTGKDGKYKLQIQSIWCGHLCRVQSDVMVHDFCLDHLHNTHWTLK